VRDWGWTGTIRGFGQLTGLSDFGDIDEDFSTLIRHVPGRSGTLDDGEAVMNVGREVRWPLAPFLGVIVTAPERGIENTVISQGPWGGNLDVRDVCAQLRVYDRAITRRARGDDTARQLMSAPGVGAVVALAYMTAIEDPARFGRSSSVAPYLGMTPRRYQSGEVDHGGRISKCGDGMVRSLLFEAAKVLLSRSARPSVLKTWGKTIGKRIGAKKATIAVARKLAVILHRMWTTGTTFKWGAQVPSLPA
jgi:hypothetical protein